MGTRSAIITGGAGGQGYATALELAAAGWRVAVFDIATAAELKGRSPEISFYKVDVTDYDAVRSSVESVVASTGQLDALLICAAIHSRAPIAQGDPRVWKRVVDVNFVGVLNSIRASVEYLEQAAWADILVWGSVSGFVAYANESVYAATKAAGVHLMDCLRQELAATNIRLSLIHPGMVNDAMTWANPAAMAQAANFEFLEPEDLARCAKFILDQPPNTCISEMVVRPARQAM